MKKKLQILFSSLVLFLLLLVGCNKDFELHDSYYAELQSDELLKIETIYKEGDVKIEGVNAIKTLETDASQAYKDKVNAELEASYSKQVSYVKNGGNLVAVFEYATCGSYSRIHINMDAEDGDGSYYQGFTGTSYVTTPYFNVILNFCVVPNTYFERTIYDYAILSLTSSLPSGVSRIKRYHDNEDNHNGNLTELDGNEITGWYGYNYFGSNIQLSWFYYPSWTTVNEFPYLSITYGVLGHFGDYMVDVGFIYIDDENHRNANSCYKEIWNGTNWTSSYFTGSITNIMDVTANTKYYISRGEL